MKIAIKYILFLIVVFGFQYSKSQSNFSGFYVQIKAYDSLDKLPLSTVFPINVKITLYDTNGANLYQETYSLVTWQNGLINLIAGTGTNTGAGIYSAISAVPFNLSVKIKIESDVINATNTTLVDAPLLAKPFANLSLKNLSIPAVKLLNDADSTTFILGKILKWNGSKWIGGNDDVTLIPQYSNQAGNSVYSDTTAYALIVIAGLNADTVLYANNSNNSAFALNSSVSNYANTANLSAQTAYASNVLYVWKLLGNSLIPTTFIGTLDNNKFNIKTNATQRLTIQSDSGWIGVNADTSRAGFHLNSINGFLFTLNSPATSFGASSLTGIPQTLFKADSASFRGGLVTGTQWSSSYNHRQTFAYGYNVISNGTYSSIVFGDSCAVYPIAPPSGYTADYTDGIASLAFGKNCQAHGRMSVAGGYGSKALFFRNVALGYECFTSNNAAQHAIGYRALCKGSNTIAVGTYVKATGHKSSAFGSYASTNAFNGCFIYGDASTTDTVKNTVANQFMVRASGGTIFYSDSLCTTGVELAAGSGSWSTLSDSTKKINIREVDYAMLYNRFSQLDIYSWEYKTQNNVVHLGPMAQSFYSKFGFGHSKKLIDMVDADGLIMALIRNHIALQNEARKKINNLTLEISDAFKKLEYESLNASADKLIELLNK